MTPNEHRIVEDLAMAAAREAMEVLLRKAKLGFDPRMSVLIVGTALVAIEAKAKAFRMTLLGDGLDSILDEATRDEVADLRATLAAGAGGGA